MQSGKALNGGRTWSDIVKPKADEPDVISRNELLGACVMSKQGDKPDLNSVWLPLYGPMRTESSAISHRSHQDWSCRSAVSVRPPLPPGLEPPPGLELPAVLKSDERVEKQQKKKIKSTKKPLGLVAPEPERFQVLLQNLPQMMLNDTFLRAMLDQALLSDVMEMVYRQSGKAIVTFGTYDSMCQCIEHLHNRQWGGMPNVAISATYVRLVKTSTPKQTDVQKKPISTKLLSADAPSFVPGLLLAAAANLHPSANKMCESGDKWNSNASTEPGSPDHSDDYDSDMEQQLPVGRA